MKIVIVSAYKIGNETGVAKISEKLSRYLSERGHHVVYFCLGQKFEIKKITNCLTCLKFPSFSIRQGDISIVSPSAIENTYQFLDQFQPDIVHLQNIVFTSLLTWLWAKRNHKPHIITFHSPPSKGLKYVFPAISKSKVASNVDFKLTSSYVRQFLRGPAVIIALNQFVKHSILKIYSQANINILNNPFDLKGYLKIKTTKFSSKIICSFFGMYTPRKNQLFLIKAFQYLPNNYHLDLFGNKRTGRDYVKKLEKYLKDKDITNVSIGDFIDEGRVKRQLRKTHLVLSASLSEAQSLTVVEALASGTPVIGLENETINELINNRNGKRLPKKTSPKRFANEVTKYVNTIRPTYQETSNNCRETVGRFNKDETIAELEKIYLLAIKYQKKVKYDRRDGEVFKLLPQKLKNLLDQKFMTKNKATKKQKRIIEVLGIAAVASVLIGIAAIFVPSLKKRQKHEAKCNPPK